jgi:hypothetical protein
LDNFKYNYASDDYDKENERSKLNSNANLGCRKNQKNTKFGDTKLFDDIKPYKFEFLVQIDVQ